MQAQCPPACALHTTDAGFPRVAEGQRQSAADVVVVVTASLETQLQSSRYTNMQMLLMCWREMLAQLLMTVCSTLVASLYIKFEPTKYDDLPTLLL